MADKPFDGIMLKTVWNGLQLKKEKNIKSMPLRVLRVDGSGMEKVVFEECSETIFPGGAYLLTGNCKINGKQYTFEYEAPYGIANASVIGFQPVSVPVGAR